MVHKNILRNWNQIKIVIIKRKIHVNIETRGTIL